MIFHVLAKLTRDAMTRDMKKAPALRTTDRGRFREVLKTVHDIERLVGRVALGTAGPRDLVALRMSIAAILPCRTVKPMTENTRPAWRITIPASPFTRAG